MKPTLQAYTEAQRAYDTFNKELFNSELPECLITYQRKLNVMGYFSPARFSNYQGEKVDEIALNPTYFAAYPMVVIMQTIVHEMVHQWQHHFGKPSKRSYHNKQWSAKMELIGLMPSSTGEVGGNKVGEKMSDYPIKGGLFLNVCDQLITEDFKFSWYDRLVNQKIIDLSNNSNEDGLSVDTANLVITPLDGIETKNTRTKYSCACGNNVWAKANLNIICGDCNENYYAT